MLPPCSLCGDRVDKDDLELKCPGCSDGVILCYDCMLGHSHSCANCGEVKEEWKRLYCRACGVTRCAGGCPWGVKNGGVWDDGEVYCSKRCAPLRCDMCKEKIPMRNGTEFRELKDGSFLCMACGKKHDEVETVTQKVMVTMILNE